MHMSETPAFDAIAAEYDKNFSGSLIGEEQRKLSRRWLTKVVEGRTELQILEINCGTGEDALWLGSLGHAVIATDESTAMINEAQKKLSTFGQKNVRLVSCSFQNLTTEFGNEQFDLIFSNFSGLNCVSSQSLNILGKHLSSLLKKDGHLAIVVFGKYNWWETLYFLLKARPGTAFRRWSNKS